MLKIFFRPKNPTASAGFEPANLGTLPLEHRSRLCVQTVGTVCTAIPDSVTRQATHHYNDTAVRSASYHRNYHVVSQT